MKVNFNAEVTGIKVCKFSTGETFLAERKSTKGQGLYMKVDACSGLASERRGFCLAVNLQSGQLRRFADDFLVLPVEAEVNLSKEGR